MTVVHNNERGVSLLEVLISIIILTVGILGLAPLMVVSINSNTHSRDLSFAMQLAKDKLELLEATDTLSSMPNLNTETGLQTKFTRTTYLIDHATDSLIPDNRLKAIVIVSWSDDKSVMHNTQMSTLLRED